MNLIIEEYNKSKNDNYLKLLINLFISGATNSIIKEDLMKRFESNSIEYILLKEIIQNGIEMNFKEINTIKLLKRYIYLLEDLCKVKSIGISYLNEKEVDNEMIKTVRDFHPKFTYPSSYTFTSCRISENLFKELLKCNNRLNNLWGIYMCNCKIEKRNNSLLIEENEIEKERDDDDDENEINVSNGIGCVSSIFPYTLKLKNLILSSIIYYI